MKADLTRNTFNPLKHFTRVLMQQGRVQLDADWNEQAAILLRYLQALAKDLIGEHGGPAGDNFGFTIAPLSSVANDFQIGRGRYYVDGILCEADATPVSLVVVQDNVVQVQDWAPDGTPFDEIKYVEVFDAAAAPPTYTLATVSNPDPAKRQLTLSAAPSGSIPSLRRAYTYLTQPDYALPDPLSAGLIYLDVWERLITYVEDDSIREVALGGPDTATRAKVVWQVKVTTPFDGGCGTVQDLNDRFQPQNRGWLKTRVKPSPTSTDPCIVSPDARYRGPENQLYRVEIHRGYTYDGAQKTGGQGWNGQTDNEGNPAGNALTAATFKWSRENGSVAFPIVAIAPSSSGSVTTTVTLENLGRDDRFGLAEGDFVEVQDEDYALQNRAAGLLSVQSIDRNTLKVTLNGTVDPNVLQNFTSSGLAKHPLLRRWDHQPGDPAENGLTLGADNAALVQEDMNGLWLDLEDGVQIQFQKPAQLQSSSSGPPENQYRTGDYWLIPARTVTGDVEWPTELGKDSQGNPVMVPIAKPPDGVTHHYAPLAVISVSTDGLSVLQPDCRKPFDTVVVLTHLATA